MLTCQRCLTKRSFTPLLYTPEKEPTLGQCRSCSWLFRVVLSPSLLQACREHHQGQWCPLYAVQSRVDRAERVVLDDTLEPGYALWVDCLEFDALYGLERDHCISSAIGENCTKELQGLWDALLSWDDYIEKLHTVVRTVRRMHTENSPAIARLMLVRAITALLEFANESNHRNIATPLFPHTEVPNA